MSGTTVQTTNAEYGVSTVASGVTTVGAAGGATDTPVVCGFHPKFVILIGDQSADTIYFCPVGIATYGTVVLAAAVAGANNITAYTSTGSDGNTLGAKGFTITAALHANDDTFTWIAFR